MQVEFEVELDDELFAEAKLITGLSDPSEIARAALLAFIERERSWAQARIEYRRPAKG